MRSSPRRIAGRGGRFPRGIGGECEAEISALIRNEHISVAPSARRREAAAEHAGARGSTAEFRPDGERVVVRVDGDVVIDESPLPRIRDFRECRPNAGSRPCGIIKRHLRGATRDQGSGIQRDEHARIAVLVGVDARIDPERKVGGDFFGCGPARAGKPRGEDRVEVAAALDGILYRALGPHRPSVAAGLDDDARRARITAGNACQLGLGAPGAGCSIALAHEHPGYEIALACRRGVQERVDRECVACIVEPDMRVLVIARDARADALGTDRSADLHAGVPSADEWMTVDPRICDRCRGDVGIEGRGKEVRRPIVIDGE